MNKFISRLLQYSIQETLGDVYQGQFMPGTLLNLPTFSIYVIESILLESSIDTGILCSNLLASINSLLSINNKTMYLL